MRVCGKWYSRWMAHKTLRLDPAESGMDSPVVLVVENIAALVVASAGNPFDYGTTGTGGTDDRTRWSYQSIFYVTAEFIGGGSMTVGAIALEGPIESREDWGGKRAIDTLARGKAEAWMERVQARLEEALAE